MNETKDKKKIAIIFPKDSSAIFDSNSTETFGGATVQMFLLAKELGNYIDLDISSMVVNFGRKDGEVVKGIKIYNRFNKEDTLIWKILKFHWLIQKVNPDVIIQHGLTVYSCLLATYCKHFGIKFVYMFASDKEAQGKYQNDNKKCILFNSLVNNSSLLISQNSSQRDLLLTNYNKKSYILYNGFEINESIEKEKQFILWVGRCDPIKNPELFLELAKKNPDEIFLMIAPETADKEYFKSIETSAKRINNLRFISFVPFNEIDSFFRCAKIFINSSEYEGFPQTFIQAFKAGTPVISLNVYPDNILSKYDCGFCANGNFSVMEKKLQNLIIDTNLLNNMSQNAYNYAKENHDIKLNAKKLLKLIFPVFDNKCFKDKHNKIL